MTLQRYKEGTKNRTESCGSLSYSDRTAGKVAQAQAWWHAPTKHSRCWGRGLAHLWCLGFTGISCQNKTNNNQIKPQAPFKPKKTKNYLQGFELILKLTFGSRDTDKFPSFFFFISCTILWQFRAYWVFSLLPFSQGPWLCLVYSSLEVPPHILVHVFSFVTHGV